VPRVEVTAGVVARETSDVLGSVSVAGPDRSVVQGRANTYSSRPGRDHPESDDSRSYECIEVRSTLVVFGIDLAWVPGEGARIDGWVDQIGVAAAEQVNSMRPEIGDGEGSLAGKRLLDRRCPLFHIGVRTMVRQGTRRQSEAGRWSQRRR
jgi:hypothetical protein